MGSCSYYLKAKFVGVFPPVEKIEDLLRENLLAYTFWQKHRGGDEEQFWREFRNQFPLVTEMLGTLVGGDCNNQLSGEMSAGDEDGWTLDTVPGGEEGEVELRLTWHEVWHMASWDRLSNFMVKKFGATESTWVSEEDLNVDPFDNF